MESRKVSLADSQTDLATTGTQPHFQTTNTRGKLANLLMAGMVTLALTAGSAYGFQRQSTYTGPGGKSATTTNTQSVT
ncbi:MAG: hypothetical protein HQK60_17950, partial [Deltaproteobacteria bacterium]|nr:hypothetical protein [Deltaproteobacteria bacterium]